MFSRQEPNKKANREFSAAIAWIPVWDSGSLGLQGLFP